MDYSHFEHLTHPRQIFDLIDQSLLSYQISGYSLSNDAALTVYYPTHKFHDLDKEASLDEQIANLEKLNSWGVEHYENINPLCKAWRTECGGNGECILADELETLQHLQMHQPKPQIYRCGPLGLWDMSYPLVIDDITIGVLFSGQIVVKGGKINWRQVLDNYSEFVDWQTFNDTDNQVEEIEFRIVNKEQLNQDHQDMLLEELHTNAVSVEQFIEKVGDFFHFGSALQESLEQLHKPRKAAAERELLLYIDSVLTAVNPSDADGWWERCQTLLNELIKPLHLTGIDLYLRDRSRYVHNAGTENDNKTRKIQVGSVVSKLPSGQLGRLSLDDLSGCSEPQAGESESLWAYRTEIPTERVNYGTLILLHGEISRHRVEFLGNICKNIGTNADTAHFIFREREVDASYRQRVALVAHSFRTPLQNIQFILEDLQSEVSSQDVRDDRFESAVDKLCDFIRSRAAKLIRGGLLKQKTVSKRSPLQDSLELIEDALERVFDAKEDVNVLIENNAKKREQFDFSQLLDDVIGSMQPTARQREVSIVRQPDRGHRDPIVIAECYEIKRALNGLFDNAIKYSFSGRRVHADLRQYEIRVRLDMESYPGYTIVSIENYGIGIPKDRLQSLGEYGIRAEIPDSKQERPGTGLGLPYAIDIFERYGGWINVTSIPAPSATEEEIRNHLRYLTTVEAALPLTGE